MAQPNQPYVPTFFDQLQNAFGIQNERTAQLQALRAQGAQAIAQQPVAQPAIPVPGAVPAGPGGFQGYLAQLQEQFKDLNRRYNTGNRIEHQMNQMGIGDPNAAAQLPNAAPKVTAQSLKFGQ